MLLHLRKESPTVGEDMEHFEIAAETAVMGDAEIALCIVLGICIVIAIAVLLYLIINNNRDSYSLQRRAWEDQMHIRNGFFKAAADILREAAKHSINEQNRL